MLCNAFDQRVDQLLDQRSSLECDEEIRTHAAVCPRCQAVLNAHSQLLEIMHEVKLPEPSRPTRAGVPIVGLVAAAATLLIAIAVGPLRTNPSEVPSGDALVGKSKTSTLPFPGEMLASAPPSTEPELAKVGNPDPYLVHQPLVSLGLLSIGDWSATMGSIDMPFGAEMPHVQTEWVDAVADGILPVQDSVTTTLNLIRRTLAGTASQS